MTVELTEAERKEVLDLCYIELASIEDEYKIASWQIKKGLRTHRRRLIRIVTKLEPAQEEELDESEEP